MSRGVAASAELSGQGEGSGDQLEGSQTLKLNRAPSQEHGVPYKTPQFHSGYNEVVINARKLNAALPQAILGFFILENQDMTTLLDYNRHVDVKKAQKDFLKAYPDLSKADVPLLILRPSRWDEPFAVYHG